jgi:hypothetical protein
MSWIFKLIYFYYTKVKMILINTLIHVILKVECNYWQNVYWKLDFIFVVAKVLRVTVKKKCSELENCRFRLAL